MSNTTHLELPYISASQAQKEVTHNDGLRRLDAIVQLSVKDADLSTPPVSPAAGDRYIVGASGTGDWTGKDGNIAAYLDGAWEFFVPKEGWTAWLQDADTLFVYNGTSWGSFAGTAFATALENGDFDKIGINTTADNTNRLAVKSDAVLLSHDDVTPGNGNIIVTLNKDTTVDDASFSFQTGFSVRSLFGLLGNDDFAVKVTPDGSTFYDGLIIDKDTGITSTPNNPRFQAYVNYDAYAAVDTWVKVPFNNTDHNDQGDFDTGDNDFTAAVAGEYDFYAKVFYKINTTPVDSVTIKLYKNGVAVDRTEVYVMNDWGHSRVMIQMSASLQLAANDTVDVRIFLETNDGYVEADTNIFKGHLLP